ncbi:MAG TPA: ankyrin repeat domain-containing protein [Steroidobacteraceae bacterium]|jgi:hypothetical protein|nr:ankyrin repeat domain-containing protein [Steroidobacteraceae bacterium]
MTPEDNAQDRELLERYRRASATLDAAPSDQVRAAILAEGRRAADERAAEQRAAAPAPQAFDASRPAANDSRWKITAFGTAGAALVAALLFAPRWWESRPVAPATSSGVPAAVPRGPSSEEKAGAPKLESLAPPSPEPSAPPQAFAPAAQTPRAGNTSPRATALQSRRDWPAPPQRQQADAVAESSAPADKSASSNVASAPAVASAAPSAAAAQAARSSSVTAPAPAALLSAAASGDVVQAGAVLDQGGAVDARDELGRTPLMLAVIQNRPEVVRLLLNRGADPNRADSSGRTPLQQAKLQNLRGIAAQLERAGAR